MSDDTNEKKIVGLLGLLKESMDAGRRDETSEERTMTTTETKKCEACGIGAFDKRGANRLARAAADLVLRRVVDARSELGDALLDYDEALCASRVAGEPAARTEGERMLVVRVDRGGLTGSTIETPLYSLSDNQTHTLESIERLMGALLNDDHVTITIATRPSGAGAEAIAVTDADVRDAERWRFFADSASKDVHYEEENIASVRWVGEWTAVRVRQDSESGAFVHGGADTPDEWIDLLMRKNAAADTETGARWAAPDERLNDAQSALEAIEIVLGIETLDGDALRVAIGAVLTAERARRTAPQ